MSKQQLNEFLLENRPQAPQPPLQEKAKIWRAIEGSPNQTPWFFRPAGLGFAGAFATVFVAIWFLSSPSRIRYEEATSSERYVASVVDDFIINLESDDFESDLSDWD